MDVDEALAVADAFVPVDNDPETAVEALCVLRVEVERLRAIEAGLYWYPDMSPADQQEMLRGEYAPKDRSTWPTASNPQPARPR